MSVMPVLRSRPFRLGANAPLLVLLAALATLFPFFYESGPLHRPPEAYDIVTFEHLTMAKNLSAEHDWLSFRRRTVDDSGVSYDVYHRFPPVGYVMIKLATMTSPGDLWGQVQAARMPGAAARAGGAVCVTALWLAFVASAFHMGWLHRDSETTSQEWRSMPTPMRFETCCRRGASLRSRAVRAQCRCGDEIPSTSPAMS